MIGCSAILAPSKAQPPAAAPGVQLLGAALLALLLALGLVLVAAGLVEDVLDLGVDHARHPWLAASL